MAAGFASTWSTPTSSGSTLVELSIGRVVKTHGVRGEVVVEPTTDDPGLRFAPGTTLRGRKQRAREYTEYEVVAVREHSGRLLLSLHGIEDRTVADTLRGTVFLIDASEAVPSDAACEYEMKASHPVAMRALSTRRTTGRKGAGQAALAAVLCLAITMSTQRS